MELYLLRHGRTSANEQRLYCGSTDLSLSPRGRAELETLAAARPLPEFDLIADTGMRRTRETAEILLPGKPSISLPGLREMDFGRFECHDYETLRHNPVYIDWITDETGDFVCPDGESRNAFYARIQETLRAFLTEHAECARICIVCHGGTVCAILDSFCTEKLGFYEQQPDSGRGWRTQVNFDPLRLEAPERI